jgi:Domain of unknown function (DUF6431)
MDWDTNVQSYLALFSADLLEELRPKVCPICHWEGFQQKHARFTRGLQTLSEFLTITILRFFCKSCKETHSVMPSFCRPKHTIANEVQEVVIARLDSGEPLKAAGKEICPGVTIDKKTVRRWKTFWTTTMVEQEGVFVGQALTLLPALVLPVGEAKKAVADSLFKWLSYIRRQLSGVFGNFDSAGLFTLLLRLHLSMALSSGP